MQVPLLDLKTQYSQIKNEVQAVVNTLLEEQTFILGKPVKQLEEKIAEYSQTMFGIGAASGSDALYLALYALGINTGNEVITTPYTFFATAGAISRLGAVPVFVDIDPVSYNINPDLIEKVITARTKAIMPVHLYGQCADMSSILEIANHANLAVIEDAAQAIGAEYRGKRAGSMGDAGCFSFFPSKNLGGIGDGGMVVTNREDLAKLVTMLREHGSVDRYHHKLIGVNSRLDAIQAAAVQVKLKYLPQWSEMRRKNADRYRQLFKDANLTNKIQLPLEIKGNKHIYNQFVIRLKERDALQHHLQEANIGTAIYYPIPLHLQECYQHLGYKEGNLPESEQAAKETLALPVYPELTSQMQEYVVETIERFFSN